MNNLIQCANCNSKYQISEGVRANSTHSKCVFCGHLNVLNDLEKLNKMRIPNNLLYAPNHLWFRKIGIAEFQIGLTVFFLNSILNSRIENIAFEKDFIHLNKNERFGILQTEKTSIDLSMPFDGEFLFSNKDLDLEMKYIIENPYHCWLAVLSRSENDKQLLHPPQYEHFIQTL